MDNLRSKLNLETAPMAWPVLAPFFARGQLLRVQASQSLLDAAVAIANDDTETVQRWQAADWLAPVSDIEASAWHAANAELWAVVVRPFVLVQDRTGSPGGGSES